MWVWLISLTSQNLLGGLLNLPTFFKQNLTLTNLSRLLYYKHKVKVLLYTVEYMNYFFYVQQLFIQKKLYGDLNYDLYILNFNSFILKYKKLKLKQKFFAVVDCQTPSPRIYF